MAWAISSLPVPDSPSIRIVAREGAEQWVAGKPRLNKHAARQPRATGPSGYLHQRRKQALRRAKVMRSKLPIGIKHDDQRDALKIVSFRDHLRADKHIDFASMHRIQRLFGSVAFSRRIAIDTRDFRGWQ